MNRQTIEQAARDYVKPTASIIPVAESIAAKEGFIAGANWRINSVWHDVNEEPIINKPFLIEQEEEWFEVDCLYKKLRWDVYVGENYVRRWAYIEDLLPDRKEETK